MGRLPNFFLAGFQKCATTWLYHCLRTHPQVFVPAVHGVYFFDIHYSKGIDWYRRFYRDQQDEPIIADTTVAYARCPLVPDRIAEFDGQAKIAFAIRNPIDRAFSHYWHEKKKGKIAFGFEELFQNYDLFDSWIVTGFYSLHIQRFLRVFDGDQILVIINDDIERQPRDVLKRLYGFLGVSRDFEPPGLNDRINQAWSRPLPYGANTSSSHLAARLWRQLRRPNKIFSSEYVRGMPAELHSELARVFRQDIERLSGMLDRDLSCWLEPADQPASECR